MPERSKRLRILAGPNGSGKSTIVKKIRSSYYCGFFVNADEIQQTLDAKKVLNLNAEYGLEVSLELFNQYLLREGKSWLEKATKEKLPINISFSENNLLIANGLSTGIYDAAIAADFIRFQLLAKNNTFTFETVVSHPSKLIFLQQARTALLPSLIPHTYRTYLFDNSAENSAISLIAEIENGTTFIPKTEEIPWWVYEHVIDPLFTERDSK